MRLNAWFKTGAPWVWLSAGGVALSVIMVLGLLALLTARGSVYFWPKSVAELSVRVPETGQVQKVLGEFYNEETVSPSRLKENGVDVEGTALITRYLVKVGNRDLGSDFRWLLAPFIVETTYPVDVVVVERSEWGSLYGYLKSLKEQGSVIESGSAAMPMLLDRLQKANAIKSQINAIQHDEIGALNYELERMRMQQRRAEIDQVMTPALAASLATQRGEIQKQYQVLTTQLAQLEQQSAQYSAEIEVSGGQIVEVSLAKMVSVHQPNSLSWFGKVKVFLHNILRFLVDEPREANTEGGVFPAVFGTVLMVMLMSVLVTPFGVVAGVYLREYAKQGFLTRLVRISVINLAGVPSIVYGVFGLGFFVYFVGGNLDKLFYPEAAPAPVFGTPGILWSAITLALLTVPVVIVATEEGLARIPRAIREGSLALGATKAETLWRIVLPMASPAMMTGLILAVARAAGEVAPLMLVGVVKLAPSMPLDGNFPYLHLERKFMHLGFHIYDLGFQSPNVEAARPLVYATALLLVLLIVVLNMAAISIRNHLREKYRALEA
jgi:phosphate transport system permease protein